MQYLPYVSWGVFGGQNKTEIAHYFASWGLMQRLYSSTIFVGAWVPVLPMIPTIPTMGRMFF
jgi:hypothetical protein